MHSSLTLRTDYWRDSRCKTAFCELARDCFDLDFSAWDSGGYWDDSFRPFTFFDATGRAVSNVCANSMELVVAGRRTRAIQLSTVATRPEQRREGLARTLTEIALTWARESGHEFTYLFSSSSALAFYQALGFRPIEEKLTTLTLARPPSTQSGPRQLDLNEAADRDLLFSLASARTPVSSILGAFNSRLLMFHALGPLRAGIVHIPKLDTVVLFERNGSTLTLCDIVARRMPSLAELLPFITADTDREIVFRFMPDLLGNLAALGRLNQKPHNSELHVCKSAPLLSGTIFPATSVT